MKAVVDTFNQEKALVEAFSVITNLRMVLFEALVYDEYDVIISCLSTVYEMVEVVLVAATVSTVSSRPGVTTGLVGLGESCIKYFSVS